MGHRVLAGFFVLCAGGLAGLLADLVAAPEPGALLQRLVPALDVRKVVDVYLLVLVVSTQGQQAMSAIE